MATFPASLFFDPLFLLPLIDSEYYSYLQRQPWYAFNDFFMMYSFKVKQCLNRRAHNPACCPYKHQGERIQRRDPRKFRIKKQMCCASDDFTKCRRGIRCKYAHGLYEYWLHPNRYRTRMCNMGLACHRHVCFFAHSFQQLRLPMNFHGNQQSFSVPTAPPCNTLVGRELGETSGSSHEGRLHDRPETNEAMKHSHMDRIMKLLDELETELV